MLMYYHTSFPSTQSYQYKCLTLALIFVRVILANVPMQLIAPVNGFSPLASLTSLSSPLPSTFKINSHTKLIVGGSGAGAGSTSFVLRYSRRKDDLTSDVDSNTPVNSFSSSTQDKDNVYYLGLTPVISKKKNAKKQKQKQKQNTNETSTLMSSSFVVNGNDNDSSNDHNDRHQHNTHIFQLDNEDDNNRNNEEISNIIMKREENEYWKTTDTVLDMIRNRNETKRYMESLLNITMPNPSDYTFANVMNTNTRNETDLSSLALSLVDSFINNTSNTTAQGKKKKKPADAATKPTSTPQQSLESLFNITTISSSSQKSKNTTKQVSNDLYALATSLMTKPPKMKRMVKQQPQQQQPPLSNTMNLNPDTPLTITDLERILSENGYVRREELTNLSTDGINGSSSGGSVGGGITTPSAIKNYQNESSTIMKSSPSIKMEKKGSAAVTNTRSVTSSGSVSGGKGVVAFPQASILSTKHVRIGTSISSSIFGIFIAMSIQRNLWLMGSIMGAILGNDIAEKSEKIDLAVQNNLMDIPPPTPGGLYGEVSLKLGRRIAESYLKIWDFIQGFWFMYRTGQLSYEYYKRYEALDKKFQIQNKMDAWNARFVEGKKNFDEWERENEIGRKVLAGLRTVWMVEENSYRSQKNRIQKGFKRGKQSKYRIVQYAIDIGYWFKTFFQATWNAITGGGNNELVDVLNGIKIQIRELNLEIVSQRMGAAIAALVLVNIVGAMFALAPPLLGLTAVIAGMIWPSWVGSAYQKVKDLVEETRARGRGEAPNIVIATKNKTTSNIASPMVEKKNFHFFLNEKGRKQWYRTGQSMFSKFEEKKSDNSFSFWPFNNSEDRRRR